MPTIKGPSAKQIAQMSVEEIVAMAQNKKMHSQSEFQMQSVPRPHPLPQNPAYA